VAARAALSTRSLHDALPICARGLRASAARAAPHELRLALCDRVTRRLEFGRALGLVVEERNRPPLAAAAQRDEREVTRILPSASDRKSTRLNSSHQII